MPEEETETQYWNVGIKEVKKRSDGSFDVTMDVPDGFKKWFMEWQGLKRWSEKRFQKLMSVAIKDHIKAIEPTENEKS